MGRLANLVLVFMLLALQYRLWVAEGGLGHSHRLQQEVRAEQHEIERLRARNKALEAEVVDLKSGLAAVEARARSSLGMIKRGERFYLVVSS